MTNGLRTPALLLALAIAACDTGVREDRTGPQEPPTATRKNPEGTGTMTEIDPGLEAYADEAARDLARRLQIDEAEVELLEARFVTWPNSALGCPEPDMMYTQALVPGYRIRLAAEDNTYYYHGARDRSPFHCPAERVGAPAAGNPEKSGDVRQDTR